MSAIGKPVKGSAGLYNPPPVERVTSRWMRTPRLDFLLAFGAAAITFVLSELIWRLSPLEWIDATSRHTLYQVSISASVTLLGFTLTSVSVLVNLLRTTNATLDTIISPRQKSIIGRTFLQSFYATLFLLAVSIVSYGADVKEHVQLHAYLQVTFVYTTAFAAFRLLRTIEYLKLLLPISAS